VNNLFYQRTHLPSLDRPNISARVFKVHNHLSQAAAYFADTTHPLIGSIGRTDNICFLPAAIFAGRLAGRGHDRTLPGSARLRCSAFAFHMAAAMPLGDPVVQYVF
jgi:hypothetical protein